MLFFFDCCQQLCLVDALADMFEARNVLGNEGLMLLAEDPDNTELQQRQTETVVLSVCFAPRACMIGG